MSCKKGCSATRKALKAAPVASAASRSPPPVSSTTVQRAAPQSYMRPARASLHGGPVVLLCHSPRRSVEATLSLLARWAVMALHESGVRGRVQSHGAGHLPLA